MLKYSTLTQKGQATIPAEIRVKLHLLPGDKVGFEVKNDKVLLIKVKPFDAQYHQALGAELSEWDSPEDDEAYENL